MSSDPQIPQTLTLARPLDSNQLKNLDQSPVFEDRPWLYSPFHAKISGAGDLDNEMGAHTNPRQRSSADLSPMSRKKPRLCPPSFSPIFPNLPQPIPLRREIHGPQRNIKSFCHGSLSIRKWRTSRTADTGDFLLQLRRKKQDDRLELDEYKKLVEERFASPGDEVAKVSSVRLKYSELSTGNEAEEIVDGSDVVSPTAEDEGKVALELVKRREGRTRVKNEPLYKELYEKAKERDIRLNNFKFEVEVLHRKVTGLRIEAELLRKAEKPDEILEELFRPLTDKEEEKVSLALLISGNSRKVLVAHESSNIRITKETLQCLKPGGWLNDEVINLYLDLLKEREKREPKKFLKCHFFSSFFYTLLVGGKHGYDFKPVKRWTSQRKLGYTLFECDKIFVPIHKEIHWCLAVINVKDESFQYLDSLGGLDNYVLKMLARYLKDEVMDKSGVEIDPLSWKIKSVDEVPLQKNGWDCGMFMLKYIDFYSRGLKLCFSQEHMPYFRKRTALDILLLNAG